MRRGRSVAVWVFAATAGVGAATLVGCAGSSGQPGPGQHAPAVTGGSGRVQATDPRDAGKYLVQICGCNDCHTPGYSETGGNVPLPQWLTGVPVGYRGPWGTTYASNLRLYVDPMSEDDWVRVMRARNDKPPMPWESLHAMSNSDLRAVYRFIKSLGKAGNPTPQDVPPGVEPSTPFLVFAPPRKPAKTP